MRELTIKEAEQVSGGFWAELFSMLAAVCEFFGL